MVTGDLGIAKAPDKDDKNKYFYDEERNKDLRKELAAKNQKKQRVRDKATKLLKRVNSLN